MRDRSLDLQGPLRALSAFLPEFERPDFQFGHWKYPQSSEPGVLRVGHFVLGEAARAFIAAAYDFRWVHADFHWPSWQQTSEAAELQDNPATLAQATVPQLEKILTAIIRGKRFCDGLLASAYDTGLLTRILRRISAIEAEVADC